MELRIAVLLTCFNRKEKTIKCLDSIFAQIYNSPVKLTVFLVDDSSPDKTAEAVKQLFPDVNVIMGNGQLFWAGGMRTAWKAALSSGADFDYYLLLNDDTILINTAIADLLADRDMLTDDKFIIVGTTLNPETNEYTYGGSALLNKYNSASKKVIPNNKSPQQCQLGNANIMLVPSAVVQSIGILSEIYTHGIADYDYTLTARKKGIKTYVSSKINGYCYNDHGNNWVNSTQSTLKQRIKYLYSAKGLAYKEYLKFIKLHFPFYLPQAWLLLWLKTFFPVIWDKYKNT